MIPSLRNEAGAGLSFSTCTWFSTYRIHHRSASRFRDRRCFLLGDAAHIHSPVGAQGMNTGLQDAYNLAWKLALVVKGRADGALLDVLRGRARPGRATAAEHDRPGVQAGRIRQSARRLAAHQDPRPDRRVRDEPRTDTEVRVSRRLPDRHPLPEEPPVAISGGPARKRAARGRSLPVAAAQVPGERRRSRICSRSSTTRTST